jgi:hypothetical protein
VLGSQLPARPLPAPYPDSDVGAGPADANSDAADSDSTSPIAVWAVLGGTLAAIAAGGAVYLRARSRQT